MVDWLTVLYILTPIAKLLANYILGQQTQKSCQMATVLCLPSRIGYIEMRRDGI